MKKEDIEFLIELQHKLNTQESDGSADPLFWGVMEKKIFDAGPGCGDGFQLFWDCESMYRNDQIEELKKWMWDTGEFVESELESIDDLDTAKEVLEKAGYSPCEIREFKYVDMLSENTGAFLTKEACEHHIKINGHNLCNPRTYAMTAVRNFEYERLLKILKTADFGALLGADDSTADEQMKENEGDEKDEEGILDGNISERG